MPGATLKLIGWLYLGRHIHLLQDEYFQVEQGVLGAITDGKEVAITKDDGILCIRAGSR